MLHLERLYAIIHIYIFIDFYIPRYIFDLKYLKKRNQAKICSFPFLFYVKILFYYKAGELEITMQRVCHDLTLHIKLRKTKMWENSIKILIISLILKTFEDFLFHLRINETNYCVRSVNYFKKHTYTFLLVLLILPRKRHHVTHLVGS